MNVRESDTKFASYIGDAISTNSKLNSNSKMNGRSNVVNNKTLNTNNSKSSSKLNSASLVGHSSASNKNVNKGTTKSSNKGKKSSKISNTNPSSKNQNRPDDLGITNEEATSFKVRKKADTNKRLKKEKDQQQVEKDTVLQSDQFNQQFDSNQQSNFIEQQTYQQINLKLFDNQIPMSTSSMGSFYSASSNQQAKNQDGWYLKEIKNMMHGFGDSANPDTESVRLIEQIVHQQVTCLLRLACDVAIQRQSKQIGLEDFLFLLRKDKVKLCRLLRHFKMKDMRNRMSSDQWTSDDQSSSILDENSALDAGCTMDFDEEELLNALISEQKNNQAQDPFYLNSAIKQSTSESILTPSNLPTNQKATIFPQPAKRLKLCLDFLASIDQTGELDRYLQEDQILDELKHNRLLRIERITRFMSEKEYLNFYKARQTSFANRLQPNKFRDWLFNVPFNQLNTDQWPIKPNALAIEILQYFAYETVAIIVDLALLVKQDQQQKRTPSDPVSKLISINAHSSAFPFLNSNGNLSYSDSIKNQLHGNTSPMLSTNIGSLANKHTNLTNLNPNIPSFGTSLNTEFNGNLTTSFNQQNNQQSGQNNQPKTTLPSPFLFSTEVSQAYCPFFNIKPQEIREVIRRYMNCNPKGNLSSVLLFGIEQWTQPLMARSKIMCL